MNVTIKLDKNFRKTLSRVGVMDPKDMRRMMDRIGENAVVNIKKRVRAGRDLQGRPFKKLSRWTQDASKPRPVRGARELPPGRRGALSPLYQTGKTFLRHFRHRVTKAEPSSGQVLIYVRNAKTKRGASAAAIASVHNAGYNFKAMGRGVLRGGRFFRIPVHRADTPRGKGLFVQRVGPRRLPKREFIGVSNKEKKRLAGTIINYYRTLKWKPF